MNIKKVLNEFKTEGKTLSCDLVGEGHINTTYLISTDRKRYILQTINESVFADISGLMRNIKLVTDYLSSMTDDERAVLKLIETKDGNAFYKNEEGCFRMYAYIEDSICLQTAESKEDFYQSAIALGNFAELLSGFDASLLTETIPNFHNTPNRYRIFKEAIKADPLQRVKNVQKEIDFILEREEEMSILERMKENGELPVRVTHNDTKLNNILLDKKTHKALCVIDLDTVMPGLSLYDYGDSIRFGASTALEDETNLDKVELSEELFEVFTKGYIEACPSLTEKEKELLPLGAKNMTLECGMRFLTDYIDGDHYFRIHRPNHNLDRARTQLKLVSDMEKKWDSLKSIVSSLS